MPEVFNSVVLWGLGKWSPQWRPRSQPLRPPASSFSFSPLSSAMAPRILRLQYESQKPKEPLSYKANLIFCVGGGHEEFFVLFCLIVDLLALLILIRQRVPWDHDSAFLSVCDTDRLHLCTGNNRRTRVGGAAWGKQVTEGMPLGVIACL